MEEYIVNVMEVLIDILLKILICSSIPVIVIIFASIMTGGYKRPKKKEEVKREVLPTVRNKNISYYDVRHELDEKRRIYEMVEKQRIKAMSDTNEVSATDPIYECIFCGNPVETAKMPTTSCAGCGSRHYELRQSGKEDVYKPYSPIY